MLFSKNSVAVVFLAFWSRICRVPLKLTRAITVSTSSVTFRSSSEATARCTPVCPYTEQPQIGTLLTFNSSFFFSFSHYCQLSLTSSRSGPALSCSPPFRLSHLLFLLGCRLKFHHLEYFTYPEVIYLASSIIHSSRQESESKNKSSSSSDRRSSFLNGTCDVCMHECVQTVCVGALHLQYLHTDCLTHLLLGSPSVHCLPLGQLFFYYSWFLFR